MISRYKTSWRSYILKPEGHLENLGTQLNSLGNSDRNAVFVIFLWLRRWKQLFLSFLFFPFLPFPRFSSIGQSAAWQKTLFFPSTSSCSFEPIFDFWASPTRFKYAQSLSSSFQPLSSVLFVGCKCKFPLVTLLWIHDMMMMMIEEEEASSNGKRVDKFFRQSKVITSRLGPNDDLGVWLRIASWEILSLDVSSPSPCTFHDPYFSNPCKDSM